MAQEKIVVETTGDFMLQDVSANQVVEAHRPSLVKRTAFITSRLDSMQLRMVDSEPADDLTDAELAKQWEKTGKVKGSKKVKADNKVAEASANTDKKTDEAKDKTAGPTITKGSPKQPGESQEDFEARLKREVADQK